jgi:hypothetical protein
MEQNNQHESIKKLLQDVTIPTPEQQPQSNVPPIIDNIEDNEQAAPLAITNKSEGDAGKEKPQVSEKLLEASANVVTATFDFTQDNLFTFFGKVKRKRKMKRLFGEDWEVKLNDAKSKLEMAAANKSGVSIGDATMLEVANKEDFSLLRTEKSFDEYFDGLALTDEEKEAIKVPLKEVMRLRGGTIPPEYLLVLTVMQIFGARGMELYDA